MILSVILFSHTYQLFQPICGVSARLSPHTILNCLSEVPEEFVTFIVVIYSPWTLMTPEILPVPASHTRPSGRLSASYFIGLSPVAATVNKNGDPGLTPNILVPLIRGSGPGLGVRMILGSLSEHEKSNAESNKINSAVLRNPVFIML
jgi:hypothetical protein